MQTSTSEPSEEILAIHEYYMDILNCMPDPVYWVDHHCALKGCNTQFINLLGLRRIQNFSGTPYDYLIKKAQWSAERVEALRLDDMAVIFHGKSQCNVIEKPIIHQNKALHFVVSRIPLLNKEKQVHGLVVILHEDSKESSQKVSTLKGPKSPTRSKNKITPKILMVEDNFVAQKVEQALLKELHCEVELASSGEEAISLFEPGKYHLVFMDIGLEDTSGYIVAKRFREKEKETKHQVPIIALTSYQAEIVKYDCADYSMNGVISKPLTMDQAKQIIDRFIFQEEIKVQGLHEE